MKALSILLAVLLISPMSFASQNTERGAERGNKGGKNGGWLKKLELSDAELLKIKAIKESGKEKSKSKTVLIKKEKELLKLIIKGPKSNAEVRKQHNKVQKLKNQLMDLRFENFLKIRKLVPAEKRQHLRLPQNKGKRGKKGKKHKGQD